MIDRDSWVPRNASTGLARYSQLHVRSDRQTELWNGVEEREDNIRDNPFWALVRLHKKRLCQRHSCNEVPSAACDVVYDSALIG